MLARLSVGVATPCLAPVNLERLSLRFFQLIGADSFFVPDHYCGFIPRSLWRPDLVAAAQRMPSPDAFFDPFVMMGMMAARYRHMRIGIGVTEAFRRHPVTLAQAFVTLDHLTKGRAILGLGNGERQNTEPYGIPFTKRVSRLEEALILVRRLWESGGEPVNFDGPTWRLRDALFATPLYKRKAPAIWVAAHAPRMLELTGRFADGWYPTIKMSAPEYSDRLNRIRAAAAAAGRQSANFEAGLLVMLALGRDRRSVLRRSARLGAVAMLLPGAAWARHGLQHPLGQTFEGFAQLVPEAVTPEQIEAAQRQATPDLLADGIIAGSIDEVIEEVRPLVAAGLRHLVIANLGLLALGAGPADLLRLAVLVRRLKRSFPLSHPAVSHNPTDRGTPL